MVTEDATIPDTGLPALPPAGDRRRRMGPQKHIIHVFAEFDVTGARAPHPRARRANRREALLHRLHRRLRRPHGCAGTASGTPTARAETDPLRRRRYRHADRTRDRRRAAGDLPRRPSGQPEDRPRNSRRDQRGAAGKRREDAGRRAGGLYLALPGFLRRLFYWWLDRNPGPTETPGGTVVLTASACSARAPAGAYRSQQHADRHRRRHRDEAGNRRGRVEPREWISA